VEASKRLVDKSLTKNFNSQNVLIGLVAIFFLNVGESLKGLTMG